MTTRNLTNVIAHSVGAVVGEGDVTQAVASLLDDAAEVMSAQAIGVVVVSDAGELDVLAATSHRVEELELYQVQHQDGPCVTAIAEGAVVTATTLAEVEGRWPDIAPRMRAAGFTSVHAFPLHWHDDVLGALNVFHRNGATTDPDLLVLGQAYADLVSCILLRPTPLTREVLHERVGQALSGRTVIEQAKGVVAQQQQVEMDVAYHLLRSRAQEQHRPITEMARQVIEDAVRPPSG